MTLEQMETIRLLSIRPSPGLYLPAWSCEAQSHEERLVALREDTTISSRLEAWRAICRLPNAKK